MAQARRGWFNIWQPSAQWGDQGNPFSAPAGMLGNNVISDPASCSLWFYADQAFWTPELAPGVSVMPLVRRTSIGGSTDRTRPTGEVVCYWDYGNFLDANAGPLIAAWDYVEATGDEEWLRGASSGWNSSPSSSPSATWTTTAWSRRRRAATAARSSSRPAPALVGRAELRPQGRLQQRPHLPRLALPGGPGRRTRPQRATGPLHAGWPTGSRRPT